MRCAERFCCRTDSITFNDHDGDRPRQRHDSLHAGRIGVGVTSTIASPAAANLVFATTIRAFALAALLFGVEYLR